MKIKVYIMHSEKIDYKNNIYKPLLQAGLMENYFLILPLSEKFKSSYIKKLLIDSDVVLCDLTQSNIFLNFEIKTATKLNKPIYYFIDAKDKNINKYKNIELLTYENTEEYVNKVINLLALLNKKDLILKRDNIYCLGKLEK